LSAHSAVPHAASLRRTDERWTRLRLRPAERPDPGLPEGREVREGGADRAQDVRRRLGVGYRLLEGPAAEVPVPRRRQEREDLRDRSPEPPDPDPIRRRRAS